MQQRLQLLTRRLSLLLPFLPFWRCCCTALALALALALELHSRCTRCDHTGPFDESGVLASLPAATTRAALLTESLVLSCSRALCVRVS